jgi:hypothetical protein
LIAAALITTAFNSFDPPFKNLKILPRFTTDRAMDSIMHGYTKALGVNCEFCHYHDKLRDTWDMASDVKPEKLICRKMMIMTTEINKKFFPPEDGSTPVMEAVTCFTCHRGKPMPDEMKDMKEEKKVDSVKN